jgi:hypothetical protein
MLFQPSLSLTIAFGAMAPQRAGHLINRVLPVSGARKTQHKDTDNLLVTQVGES